MELDADDLRCRVQKHREDAAFAKVACGNIERYWYNMGLADGVEEIIKLIDR